jgi:DNA-binding LacI/PurR family transcriptional regulator
MAERPRLDDVAARANVSPATASLVLRDRPGPSRGTRERVLAAAEALGYRADRSASLLARRRTHLLGVSMSLTNPFHAELVEDIHLAAFERGYDVVVSPLTGVRDERQTALRLADQRCEALILLGPTLTRAELESIARHTPLVVLGRRVSARGVAVVRAADDRGVAAAVDHLVDLGHRRVAFVDGPPGPISTLRRDGFRRAMLRRTGVSDATVVPGGDTEVAGMNAPLPHGPDAPTAYVCFNDRCALGVADRLRSTGLDVPADVSVVGFDDSPVARLRTVALTTVSQSPVAMARAAVDAALELVEGGAANSRPDVVLDPPLVVRSTSGPAPING